MLKKNFIFLNSFASISLFGAGIVTLGSVIPILRQQFHLTEIATGKLFSILPIGVLIGSLLFGPLCDRIGYRLPLAVSCLLMAIGFFGIALSPTFALLALAVFLFGTGGGAINGGTSALVAYISSDDRKAANLSVLGTFFGLGALSIPLALGLFAQRHMAILSTLGLMSLLTSLLTLLIRFPKPKSTGRFSLKAMSGLLRSPMLIYIGFFLFCQSSFEGLVNNWSTLFLIDEKALPRTEALYALSLSMVGMTAMRLFLGSFLRKVVTKRLLFLSLFLGLLGIFLLRFTEQTMFLKASLFLIGAGLAGGFPLMLGLTGARFRENSATAFGLVLTIALIGNVLINYVMGQVAEKYGISTLTLAMFLEIAVMAALAMAVLKHSSQSTL